MCLGKGPAGTRFIEWLDLRAVDADTAANLGDALVEHARKMDVEIEQARPRLIADAQHIGKPSIDHQEGALALTFEQRVGGHGSAHLHRFDRARRNARVERQAKHSLNARNRGIMVANGVLAQQLVRREAAIRRAGDDVGEGAAPIDPELPADAARFRWRCHCRSAIYSSSAR